MSDIELTKFYNSIKDPSWPDVNTYIDFYKLPANIKFECNSLHNFQHRKSQLENIDHWINITCPVYQYQNLVYVPVNKCASTYYTQLFDTMGWKKKQIGEINLDSAVMFGLMMDPFDRWVKGITEWVSESYYTTDFGNTVLRTALRDRKIDGTTKAEVDWDQFSKDLCDTTFKNIIDTVIIGNMYSMPYSVMFGELVNRINWVPMGLMTGDNDIKISLMNLFKKHNHSINIPLSTNRLWQSSSSKLKIEGIIKNSLEHSNSRLMWLYKLYASDLKFFHNLIDNFDPLWSSPNTQASQ